MMFDVERTWETIIAIILASAGGLARLLNAKDTTKLQWSRIFSELFISGFAGMMVLLLARSFDLSNNWLGLVCGMAGWIGPRVLDIVVKPAGKAIGLNIDEFKDKIKE